MSSSNCKRNLIIILPAARVAGVGHRPQRSISPFDKQPASKPICRLTQFIRLIPVMTGVWRDPSVAALPLDDIEKQVSGLPPLMAGEVRRGRHAERQRSISPFV